jgi:hypothetical protein
MDSHDPRNPRCCEYVPARWRADRYSQYVVSTANAVELKATLTSAAGALMVYSRGYEAQQARFTTQNSFGVIPFAEPILCVKTIGGPFEFNIEVMPIETVE